MFSRLKTFIADVAGDLLTGGFWKAVVKQSLQAAVLSAAEAAFRALGRTFRDMGDRVRKQNASPDEEPRGASPVYHQPAYTPAATPIRPTYQSPITTPDGRPTMDAYLGGRVSFGSDCPVSELPSRFQDDVLSMKQSHFASLDDPEESDLDLSEGFLRSMRKKRGER